MGLTDSQFKKNVDTTVMEIYTAADNEVGESGREWEL